MANNYYDMTGVLMLREVTPVIKALFGPYELDASYPGGGDVYIANISESTNCSWDAVIENLQDLAERLNLPIEEDESEDPSDGGYVLRLLARHFGAEDNQDLKGVIASVDFDGNAELPDLLTVARVFDDGHGLKGYRTEACWHCSKPRLFEFGGHGSYVDEHIHVDTSSSEAANRGAVLSELIAEGDLAGVEKKIHQMAADMVMGIQNPTIRNAVRESVDRMVSPDATQVDTVFVVIQEGGSSDELNLIEFDTALDAEAFRVGCAQAAYRTSIVTPVPAAFAKTEGFKTFALTLLRHGLDYPNADNVTRHRPRSSM